MPTLAGACGSAAPSRAVVRRVLDGATLPAALAAVRAAGARTRRAAAARSCRSSPTARCGTGARSTRWCARSRRSRSPIRRSRCLVAVALYQLDHTRAPPFAVVDHAVNAAAALARPAAKALVNALLRRYLREREALDRARCVPTRSRAGRIRAGGSTACSANIPDGLGGRSSRRATRGRRSRCASTAASTTREALLAAFAGAGHRRDAGGRCGHHRRAAATGARAARVRRRRVLGAGPRRAARGAAAAARSRAARARRLRGARRQDHAPRSSSPTSNSSRSTATRRGSRACARTSRACSSTATACAWSPGDAGDAARRGGTGGRSIASSPTCRARPSGVVRRHPDVKWLRREADIASFARQQARLLDALWPCLARGRPAALRDLLDLRRRKTRRRSPRSSRGTPTRCAKPSPSPPRWRVAAAQLLPSLPGASHNQDGFFYALLRKP